MVHHIQDALDEGLPDHSGRPEVFYYSRSAAEKHLSAPPGYATEAVRAVNARRSDGWKAANRLEE